jgi:hypothetical protein
LIFRGWLTQQELAAAKTLIHGWHFGTEAALFSSIRFFMRGPVAEFANPASCSGQRAPD